MPFQQRQFSTWTSFFQSKNKQTTDINVQLRELDPKKVKLTFSDIWQDYKHFKQSYYFFQKYVMESEEQKGQITIDPKEFSLKKWFIEFFWTNSDKHGTVTPQAYFYKIVFLILGYALWRLRRKPAEYYYHWHDPLENQINQNLQENQQRLKHNKKIDQWWKQEKKLAESYESTAKQ
ncbi:UNKNOWN [Stylonychia lemnae]|uniref:Uncharacterized protein n=1 Tax=Stylonychia lemnae TaxID=5949 RepID=A0A078ALU6_STYLE|nr:UNKNOWN [Stylonychia lemnae]|eukprot:CDW83199.1 UNKNOWN [Stylonychia lemnae]